MPAPPASSNYQEGGSSSSGSALPPPPAPPPLEPPPLEKRGLDQETEMTDATVEQQGESKRRREHLEVPQATDSSSSSSSSSEMCTIISENSEAESRCRGGPVTLDLTEWDFSKADCRNTCRKMVENSKPLLLIGSPMDSGRGDKERARAVLHPAFIWELYEIQVHGEPYFLHTFQFRRQLGTVYSGGFHEQVPRHFSDSDGPQFVWSKCPSQYEHADEMADKFRMRRRGTKLSDSLVHGASNDYERNVTAITLRPMCCWNDGPN